MWKNPLQVWGSKSREVGTLLLASLPGGWRQVCKTPYKRGCLGVWADELKRHLYGSVPAPQWISALDRVKMEERMDVRSSTEVTPHHHHHRTQGERGISDSPWETEVILNRK